MQQKQAEQRDVDAVASFVMAATELRDSAIINEDKRELSCSYRIGEDGIQKLEAVQFAADNEYKAGLVSFRKLYMQKEPSNYRCIHGILFRHFISDVSFCNKLRYVDAIYKIHTDGQSMAVRDTGLSVVNVIDLWLNCRVFHSGSSGREGRFSMVDFDLYKQQIGAAKFELMFREAVFNIGVCYLNLLPLAVTALDHWESELGLRPSFQISSVYSKQRIGRSEDGVIVTRGRLEDIAAYNDVEERFRRLIRRRTHEHLAWLFETIGVDERAIAAISHCVSLEPFLIYLGVNVTEADEPIDTRRSIKLRMFHDDASNQNAVIWQDVDGAVIMNAVAKAVLVKEYAALRDKLHF